MSSQNPSADSAQSQKNPEMQSIGLNFTQWQEAVEAAIATNQLSVVGEIRGGQLIQFTDPSGAQINILAVEPFATFIGFTGITQNFAHVSMVNDVLALLEVVDPRGNPVIDLAANLAQGPLLADQETQLWQQIGITAMGLTVHRYNTAADYEAENGTQPGAFESEGAGIITSGSGSTAPHPGARFSARVLEAQWLHNQLTGEKFMHLVMDGEIPFDLCLPGNRGELPSKGTILAGTALLTASILTPMSGCGSGGCGCGSGGCGGH